MPQTNTSHHIDRPRLKLFPFHRYAGIDSNDPLRFYFWPVIGRMFRQRVELCLAECTGGRHILEVGFGAGVTFPNLNEMYEEIYGLDTSVKVEDVKAVFEAMQIKTNLQNGSVLSMPYESDFFDTVLLISTLEHLKPSEQSAAFSEVRRVLKPGGQVIYGVPVERPLMVFFFRLLGFNIRQHHFSTEKDVFNAANSILNKIRIIQMKSVPSIFGPVYEVGHFVKKTSKENSDIKQD